MIEARNFLSFALLIFALNIIYAPRPLEAQNATLQITITAPAEVDLLAQGATPGINCSQQSAPYNTFTQPIYLVQSGTYRAELSVSPGLFYLCAFGSQVDGLNTGATVTLQALSGQTTPGALTLTFYDAEVTLFLVTRSGGSYIPFPVPEDSPDAVAFCFDTSYEQFFFKALQAGDLSATIKLIGGTDYYCQVTEINGYGTGTQFFNVGLNDHLSGQTVLVPFDASAIIHLVDQDGQAVVATSNTYLYCNSNELPFSFPAVTLQSGASSASIALSGGHAYSCNITGIPEFAAIYDTKFFLAVGESGQNADLPLAPLNEQLSLELSQPDGDPYIVSAQEYVYASCQGPHSLFFSQQIASAESSVDFAVLPGAYTCWATVPGRAVQAQELNVSEGVASQVTIPILAKNATIHAQLQNQAGQALTTLDQAKFSVWPKTSAVIDWSWGTFSNGTATIPIAADLVYRVLTINAESGCGQPVRGSDGEDYLFLCQFAEIQAAPGETKELPLTVYKSDATVNATVLGVGGAGKGGVRVQAVETVASAGSNAPLISSALTNAEGIATIPIVSTKTFAIMMLTSDAQAGMAPPGVELTLLPQAVEAVTLRYEAIDFHLHVTAAIAAVDHGYYYCYAYDSAGHLSRSETGTPLGQRLTLPLLSAATWHVGCNGANESVYFSTDEIIYTPPTGQLFDEIVVSTDSAAYLYSKAPASALQFHIDGVPFSSSFTVLTNSSTALQATSSIGTTFPAGTFDTEQSQLTITVSHAAGIAANAIQQPVMGTSVMVAAADGSGNEVSVANGKTFSLSIVVADTELPGIDPYTLRGARFDPSSGSFTPVTTTLERAGDASWRYTLTASQTGNYLLLKPRAANEAPIPTPTATPTPNSTPTPAPTPIRPPKKPKHLSIRVENGRQKISWDAPTQGETVESYRLKILRGKKTVLDTEVPADSRSFIVGKKLAAGAYVVWLSATNSAGSGGVLKKSFEIALRRDGKRKRATQTSQFDRSE